MPEKKKCSNSGVVCKGLIVLVYFIGHFSASGHNMLSGQIFYITVTYCVQETMNVYEGIRGWLMVIESFKKVYQEGMYLWLIAMMNL